MNTIQAMEDARGTPWIARLPWYWAVAISLVTAGVFPLLIGIYLSAWLRGKRHSGLAVYGFGMVALLAILELFIARFHLKVPFAEGIDTAGLILWVISSFLLRREIQINYAWPDGSLPEISVLWTLLFSVFYLNYCVWARSDTD